MNQDKENMENQGNEASVLEVLREILKNKGEALNMLGDMVTGWYIKTDARKYGIGVEEFLEEAVKCIMASYEAYQNTDEVIKRDVESGKLSEEDAQKLRDSLHKLALVTIENDLKEWVEETGGEAVRRAEERSRESRTHVEGDGKREFRSMGYYQLCLDKEEGTLGCNAVELYKSVEKRDFLNEKTDISVTDFENENDETVLYDYLYFMPVGGIGEDDYSEARREAKALEDDEHVSVAGGEYGAMLQLVRTFSGDEGEAEHLRELVRKIEESYYGCLALETDTKILVFMRLRNLYGGVLDEDEILEEATRAAKALEGNIALLHMSDRKKEVEGLDFSADRFVSVFKSHVGAIVKELEREESRWE